MKKFPFWFRIVNLGVAMIQNMSMGGILFGWASISGTLLIAQTHEGGSGLDRDYVHLMFVVASFFSFMGPLLLGIVLDYYGPRVCSILSISLIGMGCVLFSISDVESAPFFMPAICLIAFGGPGVQSAIIHLSNLFPTKKATATAMLTGCFSLSFVVFVVFDYLWQVGEWTLKELFMGLCIICLLNIVASMLLWPDTPYSFEEQIIEEQEEGTGLEDKNMELVHIGKIRFPSVFVHHSKSKGYNGSNAGQTTTLLGQTTDENTNANSNSKSNSNSNGNNNGNSNGNSNGNNSGKKSGSFIRRSLPGSSDNLSELAIMDLKNATLMEQAYSPEYIYLTVLFVVHTFWMNFYLGVFDVELGDRQAHLSADEKHIYANQFTVIITCGVVGIPVLGYMMDSFGFPASSLITIIFGMLWSLLLTSGVESCLITSFVFYALYRACFFTFVFAYLADTLGFKYFGVLAGVMFVLGGVLGLISYPLATWAAGSCHQFDDGADPECTNGYWGGLDGFAFLTQTFTLMFSYQDWKRRKAVYDKKGKEESNSLFAGQGLHWEKTEGTRGYGAVPQG